METCNPEGRSCIEKNFAGTFDCNMTCEGVFADVQWVDEQMEEAEEHDQVEVKFKNIDEEEFAKLVNEVEKRMQRMKGTSDKKGEELDKVKFQKMISEYEKFKMNSVKHLRFNSVANSAKFGQFETFILILFPIGIKSKPIKFQERNCVPVCTWSTSTLTRRPSTTSSETRRSRWRPS